MIRSLHRWPGLLALIPIVVLTFSGSVLSLFPAAQSFTTPAVNAELKIGELVSRIQLVHTGVEQIRRAPTGRITAYWFEGGAPSAATIDPATGQDLASADPSKIERWLSNLHRSMLLGDSGRIAMAMGALAMLVLALSGLVLLVRRVGGWRCFFAPLHGSISGRLHLEIARISVLGLVLSSSSALWMAAQTFDLLTIENSQPPFPARVSGRSEIALNDIELLRQIPVAELRELSFPFPDDTNDVFTLKTNKGTGYLDQGTGALLGWANLTTAEKISEKIYTLHTGQGAAFLGLLLGVMALGVPLLCITGFLLWAAGQRARPKIRNNIPARRAQTIVLVGSEGGCTWGFAATLHKALTELGQSVHTAPMSAFRPNNYPRARRLIVLAATYGDGDAPASAKRFLNQMSQLKSIPDTQLAVLGFGDRRFPAFCGFAEAISLNAKKKNWPELVKYDTVDRQSTQDFSRWGHAIGAAMGVELELSHLPVKPESQPLMLISRREYGVKMMAPSAILRFSLPKVPLWRRWLFRGQGQFQAGDLLGVLPEGSELPRFYSLACGQGDGFVEIVVSMHPGGLCSGQLLALQPGEKVSAFFRANPSFRADQNKPLILIGAGSGIAPLAGFVRGNGVRRPIHLFFGMRHPDSDFLYNEDLMTWQATGNLERIVIAVSRVAKPRYVQDALRAEATQVAGLIRNGAQVMVCGGRDMAVEVSRAFEDILAPHGLTPFTLKAEGRYLEDVY